MSTDVSKNVSASKRFVMLEIDARVVAATMAELNIQSTDEQPDVDKLPSALTDAPVQQKREFLKKLSEKVIDRYVLKEEKIQAILEKVQKANEKEITNQESLEGRFKCRFPGCNKTYQFDGKRRRDHEATHGLFIDGKENCCKSTTKEKDDTYNYQSSFLEIGLLVKNFYDAISEGDGQRVVRCWKFMLAYLKEDGASSRKYALEALYLMCQVNSLLSPRAAHRLIWNRFFKTSSGLAGNIPLDLAMEHFNRIIKIVIRNLGPHGLNKLATDRYCKSLPTSRQLLENFDRMCGIYRRSGAHVSRSAIADLRKVVKELVEQRAFQW